MWPLALLIGAYLIVGHVLRAKAPHVFSDDPPPAPKPPKQTSKPMAPTPSTFDPAYPLTGFYKSDPDKAVLNPRGQVTSDGYMTMPLWDPVSRLDARLDQVDAEKALARLGFRLLSLEEWQALYARRDGTTLELEPVTLVHVADDQYHMRSLGFQKKHDDAVDAQLAAHNYDGSQILLNDGKQYLQGRKPGKELEWGWDRTETPQLDPIQNPGSVHEETYTDYSQKTQGKKV